MGTGGAAAAFGRDTLVLEFEGPGLALASVVARGFEEPPGAVARTPGGGGRSPGFALGSRIFWISAAGIWLYELRNLPDKM